MPTSTNPTRTEYLSHIEKQKASGLSVQKYCEQNNLNGRKFSYYRHYKLGSKTPVKNKSSFAPVEVITTKSPHVKPCVDPVWLADFVKAIVGE